MLSRVSFFFQNVQNNDVDFRNKAKNSEKVFLS